MSTTKLRQRLLFLITIIVIVPLMNLVADISPEQQRLFITTFVLVIFISVGCIATVFKLSKIFADFENRIRYNEAHLQNIMESAHEGIFTVNGEGAILEINKSLCEMLNYNHDYIIGKNMWNYLLTDKGKPNINWFVSQEKQPVNRINVKMKGKKKDGNAIFLNVDLIIIKEKGALLGIRGFAEETKRKIAVENVKMDLFFTLYQQIREEMETYTLLASVATNEIKTKWLALREKILSRINPYFFHEVHIKSRHEPISVISVLNELKIWAEPLARIRDLNLIFEFPEQEEVSLLGDAEKLLIALKNIILNAIRYNHQSGTVKVWTISTAEEVKIIINDTGPGISRQDQESIFDQFYSGDTAEKDKTPRLGMGLWLAKQYVELHHGHINLESELGKGTFVFVHIPHKIPKKVSEHVKWQEQKFIT